MSARGRQVAPIECPITAWKGPWLAPISDTVSAKWSMVLSSPSESPFPMASNPMTSNPVFRRALMIAHIAVERLPHPC